jgi:hypothetical protein
MQTFVDPRTLPDFKPEFLPLCDGGDAPEGKSNSRYDRLMLEFLAAYYELNVAQAAMDETELKGDPAAQRAAMKEFVHASRWRDELEDRHAPEGFYAEPVMSGSRYANLLFHWANKPQRPRIYSCQFTAEYSFE